MTLCTVPEGAIIECVAPPATLDPSGSIVKLVPKVDADVAFKDWQGCWGRTGMKEAFIPLGLKAKSAAPFAGLHTLLRRNLFHRPIPLQLCVCGCVCVLAFNRNAQTAAQVIKFLLLQMGCGVVTSCMVTEEHVNEFTRGGPKEAGIISKSTPLKKQAWVYSPDSRAETHTAGSVSEQKL